MELDKIELELCSHAKGCKFTSCPHIKPHKTITKGVDKCAQGLCIEVGTHVRCNSYIFERKVVETIP